MARRCRPLQLLACLTALTALSYTRAQRGTCSHEGQPPCRGEDGLSSLLPEGTHLRRSSDLAEESQ